ncbi:hypothetical protein [Vibrio alginolyticus]|uniref:hypothetical protein n=1 Tax=Vibrio alginolyticus TaxID=663 RepID=UPI0006CA634C|nr:hypothetical protein [Vibrio alginolyticus]KPM98342.1 hypothetical protein AOG25_07805 [Vibrio alginolyticus]
MKITYYAPHEQDIELMTQTATGIIEDLVKTHKSDPKAFGTNRVEELLPNWLMIANTRALSAVLTRDGLINIEKTADLYSKFSDIEDDTYCPEANPDICELVLKKERRKEQARASRQGINVFTVYAEGQEVKSMGGFIGDDFYEGYEDIEPLDEAITALANSSTEGIRKYMNSLFNHAKMIENSIATNLLQGENEPQGLKIVVLKI